MNVTKSLVSLILGIVGGFIAFFIANEWKSEPLRPEIRHEIIGPGVKQVAFTPDHTGLENHTNGTGVCR